MNQHEGPPGTWPGKAAGRTPHQEPDTTDTRASVQLSNDRRLDARERLRRRRDLDKIQRAYRGDVVPRGGDADVQREAGRTTWAHFADSGVFADAGPFAEVVKHALAAPYGACGCERCSGGRAVA